MRLVGLELLWDLPDIEINSKKSREGVQQAIKDGREGIDSSGGGGARAVVGVVLAVEVDLVRAVEERLQVDENCLERRD
jgi:hypothetical protein